MSHAMTPADWRSSEDAEYAFMLFHHDTQTTQYHQHQQAQVAAQYAAPNMHPALCNNALSDEEILDEIFQEIMSPGPQDQELPVADMASSPALFSPVLTPTSALATASSSAPSTPQLTSTIRRPSASLGSISPNMAAALRVPTFPMGHATGAARNTAFFPMLTEQKVRVSTGLGAFSAHHSSMLFTSPTAASRRGYRRTNRPSRMQKKKPASRICRMPGCTKGIRSRGLCKAHGGGRRCTTPGCEISDQGGGHCIAHGGGRRCSVTGCQKSAQSKGLCKLHGGARLCRLPDCNKNGQIKGLCRLHYSLTMATKNSAAKAAATVPSSMPVAVKLENPSTCGPCDFELRV
ncbi:WRKY transcription factor 19 [Phytophthora cinnamomi]|uniref:WRKY transcription factor 19 n=1 Tax=Phytophthora cinnamomi TaxID=4785 RepID=UPI00355A3AB3|nr:WRKY transcription factor 19 [Phytophthora cinnamomi]